MKTSVATQSAVKITPVRSKRELDRFVKLPFALYKNEPNWIAPLIWERKQFLNRRKNPFFKHARAEYFLATRDGQPVGRISAHVDDNFQEFHKNRWGFFGFFESENDPQTAEALIDAACRWLKEQGCDHVIGPCDFTTNDPCGVLIEGFDRPPLILTPWNHRYYGSLIEGVGLTKAMDLFMWNLEFSDKKEANPVLWELADRLETRHGVHIRSMRRKKLVEELDTFRQIYNEAWKDNWAFVPLSEDEVSYHAKQLKPILSPEWTFVAERSDGEAVAAALTLPDYNQVLSHLNGRLLPFGWVKALYWRRKIDRVRVFALGVKPKFRHTGVAAKMYTSHFEVAQKTGVRGSEMGWILEVNRDMNRAMEAMNGRIVRRLRIYQREL